MNDIIYGPLFAITLTLLAYQGAMFLYNKSGRTAILHPTISGATLIALALLLMQQDYHAYYKDVNWLTFLLGPATVALAVPLYRQLHLLRNMASTLLITVTTGAIFASTSALIIAWFFGANRDTLLSLTTKSITTPIAITVTEDLGGITTIAVASVILTGVVGITTITWLFNKLDIQDDRLWGFCLGLSAHAIGTSRAFERSPVAGAFSSLALCLTGTFTAVFVPFAAGWFL
ncbi:LrgB family protein [Zhongshania arctica]|uniref:LrgB family protein n=1 Tax=Zhongshania arctica TaxID=3238302 RepID=A0ABV3TRM0_9GAMM